MSFFPLSKAFSAFLHPLGFGVIKWRRSSGTPVSVKGRFRCEQLPLKPIVPAPTVTIYKVGQRVRYLSLSRHGGSRLLVAVVVKKTEGGYRLALPWCRSVTFWRKQEEVFDFF